MPSREISAATGKGQLKSTPNLLKGNQHVSFFP
jgi:hypothetical protein